MLAIGNRRAWLVVVMLALVLLLATMRAHGEIAVFDGGAFQGDAGVASDRDAVNPAGLGQQVCDDFTLTADAHTVTGIEWAGLYGVLGETEHSETFSPDDDFTIVFYDDADGLPDNVVAQYRPGNVTRLSLGNGVWSYRYSLPNPLNFEPGRTYHVAIVNNITGNAYWCWSQDNSAGTNLSAPTATSHWIQWPGNCAFRLAYTEQPVQASMGFPLLFVGLVGAFVLGLHRYVL